MERYKKIFIPYRPTDKVNYIYLISLYKCAERYEEKGIKTDIPFTTIQELTDKMNSQKNIISQSTVRRLLKDSSYKDFFNIEECGTQKWIILNNDVRTGQLKPFVVLNPNTYNLLYQEQDNMLAKYTIYLKYMCGLCGGQTDITANQFLTTFGYSTKSNDTKDRISKYNKLLEDKKIIKIIRTPLEDGKRRNIYTFIDI